MELIPTGMEFTWKLESLSWKALGASLPTHYGIQLAKVLDFPPKIISRAEEVSHELDRTAISAEGPPMHSHLVAQRLLCLMLAAEEMTPDQLEKAVSDLKLRNTFQQKPLDASP